MTDPRIEAGAAALYEELEGKPFTCADNNEREEFLFQAQAALKAADAAAWRPIESAPRDGTAIILGRAAEEGIEPRVTCGDWFDVKILQQNAPDVCESDYSVPCWESWDGGFPEDEAQPTHWMPLPAPPTETAP